MLVLQLEGYPFQTIGVDFVGPLPRTSKDNKCIFTLRDTFTKWAEAFPSSAATAAVATNHLTSHFFPRFSLPEVVYSDQGTHFTARFFADSLKGMGIKVTVTQAFNLKSNPVERFHCDLGPMLSALTADSGQSWEDLLPQAMFVVNTTVLSPVSPASLHLDSCSVVIHPLPCTCTLGSHSRTPPDNLGSICAGIEKMLSILFIRSPESQ